MTITEQVRKNIIEEYNNYKNSLYAGKTRAERKELDQFFTPPELTIKMIEKMDCEDLSDKVILDPCCGSGNLLMACLIAGAKLDNLYGNDYDKDMVIACRNRLKNYLHRPENAHILAEIKNEKGKYAIHIHRGNAMQKLCLTEFSNSYNSNYKEEYIDDPKYAQGHYKTSKNGIDWETENKKAYDRKYPPMQINMWN